jgi:hypothetical protein
MSNIDQESLIAEIFDKGKKEGRWNSTQEMEDKEGIPQETISMSILAYNERKTLGLDDHLNNRISTNDINESRPLESQPRVRRKLLEKRAKGEIKGSGHVVHELAKRLSQSPNSIIGAFLEDKLDFSNLTKEIQTQSELNDLQLKQKDPIPVQMVTPHQEKSLELTDGISEKKIIDDKKPTQETKPSQKQTDADRLQMIIDFEQHLNNIRNKNIMYIRDYEMLREALKRFRDISEICGYFIGIYSDMLKYRR